MRICLICKTTQSPMLAILIGLLIISVNTNWNAPVACEITNQGTKHPISDLIQDTTEENIVLDKIYKIPEVRKKSHFIDSLTNHKHGISMIITKRPSANEPYYMVQVGYNNEIRFEPYYIFCVYKKNLVIKVYDTSSGEIISLEDWRKRS
jgi:hypothetical protein